MKWADDNNDGQISRPEMTKYNLDYDSRTPNRCGQSWKDLAGCAAGVVVVIAVPFIIGACANLGAIGCAAAAGNAALESAAPGTATAAGAGMIGLGAKSVGNGAAKAGGLSDEVAATFRGGQYATSVLSEDMVLYRAGVAGKPLGQFFSTQKPFGVIQTRIDKAIPLNWGDGTPAPLDTGFAIRIPRGTTIHSGDVANQGGIFMGGTGQVFISQPWKIPGVEVVGSWPLR